MPSPTFTSLSASKRSAFVARFLLEFSNNSFDEASISRVVKELGIAKGSVYQYFSGKLDLFLFLKTHS